MREGYFKHVLRGGIANVTTDFRASLETLVREVGGVDVMAFQDIACEILVFSRYGGRCARCGDLCGFALEFRWHNEIDPVWLAADMLVDPLELEFQLLRRRYIHCAEYAHATHLRYLDNDVSTMRKRQQRKLDPKHVTDGRIH